MDPIRPNADALIPLALLERVHARATIEHRAPSEIVHDAISDYLRNHVSVGNTTEKKSDGDRQAALRAGVRIRERRRLRRMPDGMTIRTMIDFGRD